MILRHVTLQRELVEQRTLSTCRGPIMLSSCSSAGLNQRTSAVSTADFFNKIGQEQTLGRSWKSERNSSLNPARLLRHNDLNIATKSA